MSDKKEKPEGYVFGRPTKYKPEYCEQMVEFFSRPHTKEVLVDRDESGKNPITKTVANPIPTFERFAFLVGVTVSTLWEWEKEHDDFSKAYKLAKSLQKDMLIQNTMLGFYKENFAKFFAINSTDMRDTVEHKHELGASLESIIGTTKNPPRKD